MVRVWLFALLFALIGCSGAEAPPIDELALRDALGASPSVLTQLTEAQLKALADRLETARRGQSGAEKLELQKTPEADVRLVDEARKGRGEDALIAGVEVAAAIEPRPTEVVTSTDPLPPFEGTPATDTASAEKRALDGRAGSIVLDLLRTSGAKRIERVVQWPIGAVAIGDTVYVNAAWLVAMASLESVDAGTPRPTLQPAALHGNPYNTYASLAACTTDVGMRCDACLATGGCDESATLSDFGNGRAECEWLVADKNRIAQLCAAALMSMSTVARCVRDRSGCSITNPTNTTAGIASAAAFLKETRCVQALNACLSGETNSATVFVDGGSEQTSAPPDSKGCQDPFTACASAYKGCDKACQSGSCSGSGGPSCGKTSSCSSCSSCNSSKGDSCDCGKSSSSTSSSPSSSSGGKNCGGCKNCETARSPVEPYLPPIALLAPLLYLAVRSRRRA